MAKRVSQRIRKAEKRRKRNIAKGRTGKIQIRFTDELAEEILTRVRNGETLGKISKDEFMPDEGTLYDWAANKEEFAGPYMRARRAGLLKDSESLIEIADDGKNDYMEREARNGKIFIQADHENIHRSKLRIETRQWQLARLIPEYFGPKVDLSNKDGSLASAFEAAVKMANGVRTGKA